MKNNFYFLLMFVAVGFTSCQKAPYATFQKSQSETFARTIKTKPVAVAVAVAVEAVQTPEIVNQVPASNITVSSSDEITFDEPASADLFSPIEATTPVEEVVTPVAAVSKVAVPATSVKRVSGKNKLLNKIIAKKINKLNKKAEKANSSTVRGSGNLLYVGLVVLAIGLLLTLVPVANVLAGIVIAAGAIIAIIGLLQRIL